MADILYLCDMKRWTAFIFVLFAYGIALLHTAVPHQHADGSKGRVNISHRGCVISESKGGFLQSVLSTDLGYGQLETFQKNSGNNFSAGDLCSVGVAVIEPRVILISQQFAKAEFSGGYIGKFQKQLILFSATPFRAPPAVS